MPGGLLGRRPHQLCCALIGMALALIGGCNGQSPQSLMASGQQLSARGDFKAAVIQYKVALQRDPRSIDARILLGEALLKSGDAAGAAIELAKALQDLAPPDRVLPSLSRAMLLSEAARKLTATYGESNLSDKQAQAEFKTNVAAAWVVQHNRDKTQAAVAAALAAVPDYPPARLIEARLLAGAGKLDEAKTRVDQALAADDKLYEGWQLRAALLGASGADPKDVDAALVRSLAINPAHVPAYEALIPLRLQRGDLVGAKEQMEKFRQVLPRHPLLLLFDGQLAYLQGDLPRAREIAQVLLREASDNVPVLLFAGTVQGASGSTAQAQAYFGRAVQLNPGLEVARRNLAQTQIALGQYDKAMETLKPMLDAKPPSTAALALAGDTMLRQDRPADAEKYYRRALSEAPNDERLQTAAAIARVSNGDDGKGLADLESLATKAKDTFADRALFAARLKRREYDLALAVLDSMLKKVPSSQASNYELRGRVELARKNLPAARSAFESALKTDPSLFSAVRNLALMDLQEDKPAQAMLRLQAAATADPRNPDAPMALAQLKLQQGAPLDEVKKLLASAITASPTAPEPRLALIDLLLRKRQFKDALAAASDAMAALPGDLSVLKAVGVAQVRGGDVEQAINTYRRLAAALPQSAQPLLELAGVYGATGQRAQAESTLKQALALEPDNPAVQAALLDILAGTGRQTEALGYIRQLRQKSPAQPFPFMMEAIYEFRLKNTEAGLAVLREGIAKTDSSALAVEMHKALLKADHGGEADAFGAAWMRKHPNDIAFTFQLAATELARNQYGSAEEKLKRVVDAAPNQVMALNNLAWVLVKLGKPGAVTYAERAFNLLPDNPDVIDTLALALAAEKRYPAALEMQRRAIDASPKDNGLRLNLAKLALQAGDKALAKQELMRLKALGAEFPDQAEVAQLLQNL